MSAGPFTILRREFAPLPWGEIVGIISQYARSQGIRWDDAARALAAATTEPKD